MEKWHSIQIWCVSQDITKQHCGINEYFVLKTFKNGAKITNIKSKSKMLQCWKIENDIFWTMKILSLVIAIFY